MKKLVILALLALEMIVCGCGTHTPSTTVTTSAGGNWQAVMQGGDGQAGALNFVTEFSVGSGGGGLTITTFSFLTTGVCFASGENESGSATLTTDSTTNAVTGTLTYSVTGISTGTVLTLDGTTVTGTSNAGKLTGGVVTGTWSLSSSVSGCTGGSGSFTMTQTST